MTPASEHHKTLRYILTEIDTYPHDNNCCNVYNMHDHQFSLYTSTTTSIHYKSKLR